jgi:hypothetical protein
VAKVLYFTKQARPDTSLAIAFLQELRLLTLMIGRNYAISRNIDKEFVIDSQF